MATAPKVQPQAQAICRLFPVDEFHTDMRLRLREPIELESIVMAREPLCTITQEARDCATWLADRIRNGPPLAAATASQVSSSEVSEDEDSDPDDYLLVNGKGK